MLNDIILFIIGLLLLYIGAELLVRGASRLAYLARIRPMVIGLTVVAFGTSFPEFVTSLVAAWQDRIDVAIGNIVGSNIANICLILGISSLLRPILVKVETVSNELFWLLGSSLLFLLFSVGGYISTLEGLILFIGIIVFTSVLIRSSVEDRKNNYSDQIIRPEALFLRNLSVSMRLFIYVLVTLAGMAILVSGSDWLITSATHIARKLGVSDMVIGLSLVAFGTSLPELATALISVKRKENDILIGNIVGSNIYNLLFVGGLLATFFNVQLDSRVITFDIPVMLLISLMLVPLVFIRKKFSRISGGIFLAVYVIYIIYIFTTQ